MLTVSGLPERAFPAIDWGTVAAPDGVAVSMRYGSEDGQVGIELPQGDGEIAGHGSFDVGPDGSIYVEDWVNGRIQVFTRRGVFARAFRSPVERARRHRGGERRGCGARHLGGGCRGVRAEPEGRGDRAVPGRVRHREPRGRRARRTQGDGRAGSQWAAVRTAPGRPLAPELQARMQSAVAPQPDGAVGLSQSLSGWPDRLRVGA